MGRLLLVCGALAVAGCGEDDCTAGCEKVVECESEVTLEQCTAECSADEGNREIARCYATVSGCDRAAANRCNETVTTTCHKAIEKVNACMAAVDGSQIKYSGWCSDHGMIATAASAPKEIPIMTWSKEYLACTIDAQTCRCPGQTWYTDL